MLRRMGRIVGVSVSEQGLGVGRAGRIGCLLLLGAFACGKADPQDLSTQQLSMVINGRRPELQQCYEQALAKNPSRSEVRMHAAIHIKPDGQVYEVQVDDGGLPGMKECLEQAIGTWSFPTVPDETHASLPLIFRPEEASMANTEPKQPKLGATPSATPSAKPSE